MSAGEVLAVRETVLVVVDAIGARFVGEFLGATILLDVRTPLVATIELTIEVVVDGVVAYRENGLARALALFDVVIGIVRTIRQLHAAITPDKSQVRFRFIILLDQRNELTTPRRFIDAIGILAVDESVTIVVEAVMAVDITDLVTENGIRRTLEVATGEGNCRHQRENSEHPRHVIRLVVYHWRHAGLGRTYRRLKST